MNKHDKTTVDFFKHQIDWCQRQNMLLENIENHLLVIRQLAEYRLQADLSSSEINELQIQIQQLEQEIMSLELQLNSDVIH